MNDNIMLTQPPSLTTADSPSTAAYPVVIIGAGLAGLTAAIHLAARGIPPLLLDPDKLWPGGRLAGGEPDRLQHQGRAWTFESEHGVHALWGGYVNLRATLDRFLEVRLQPSSREEWINRWGREVRRIEAGSAVRRSWLPAPFHYLSLLFAPRFWATITPLDFLSLPGFLFSLLWTVGQDPLREGVALDGLTLDDYFRGWTPNLRATITGVGVNMLAAPKESISLTALVAALRFYTMLRRTDWHPHYLPGNPHTHLIAPLIAQIEARGGKLLRGAEALRLERLGSGWRVIYHDSLTRLDRSLYADQVILAAHAPGAARLLLNSDSTRAEAARLTFPGSVRNATVRLWFSTAPEGGAPAGMFTGDFLPDNFFWLHRLYDDFREWHAATGGSAIELHLYAGDVVLERQPDNVLIIRCVDEVQRAFPSLKGQFLHGVIRRNSRVHTAFRVPTAESLHLVTPWDGITACGDWIGYDTPSLWMERACTTGVAAANRVLESHGLDAYPVLQPHPPEALARAVGAFSKGVRLTLGRALIGAGRRVRGR
jgi:isorenieratene synthase